MQKVSNEQVRTSESIKNMNTRLFGGDGQKGIIEHLFEQAEKNRQEFLDQSEKHRQEFLDAVCKTSQDAANLVLTAKKEADTNHSELNARVTSVEKKVWYGTGFGAALGFLMGVFGHK